MVSARPSLTPMRTDRRSISGLAGLRVKCRLRLAVDGRARHQESGELLFSETGISGICVMQCSRFAEPGRSICHLDLISDLFDREEYLISELFARRKHFAGDPAQEILRGLCGDRLAYAVCKQAGLLLRGEKVQDLSDPQLRQIAAVLRDYQIRIEGVEGFDRAQVMAGGADCGEVAPENMESRLVPGLHLTGELLNVDGDCGGFNLMFAALSGIRAGRNGRESIQRW